MYPEDLVVLGKLFAVLMTIFWIIWLFMPVTALLIAVGVCALGWFGVLVAVTR